MSKLRVSLYDRLPEIYRIRDAEQQPPEQLKHYLTLFEDVFGEIHKNIEALYHDLFIETCDDWVIPYIGDLLGTTNLSGDAWTLRADVADTIALRRRKGTLASIERLTYNLTQWGVHCVELLGNLVWNQHLNHQRPDVGGAPPYGLPSVTRFTPIRGGTITLRDPAMLSLLNTPFDPFAHLVDVKPPALGNIRYNLPNLAIFLWRLEDYQVRVSRPVHRGTMTIEETETTVVRFDVHPLGRPTRLFNTFQFEPDKEPPVVTELDRTPGPIPTARLTRKSEAGKPENYLSIDIYDENDPTFESFDMSDVGLQLHFPLSSFSEEEWPGDEESPGWTIRGENLSNWEEGLLPQVQNREVVIDPVIGRIVVGVALLEEAEALVDHLLVTYTYGAVGPVGAHPTDRFPLPGPWDEESPIIIGGPDSTVDSLNEAIEEAMRGDDEAVFIEIRDSLTHVLDLADIEGLPEEDGGPNLLIHKPILVRAAGEERPVIKLCQPLRFRPHDPSEASRLTVRLEGLFLTRDESFPEDAPLVARAAINKLEIIHCTLDPGGHRVLDGSPEGSRAEICTSVELREPYGFDTDVEELAFDQTPEIVIQYSITGPLLIDTGYTLSIMNSIIDGGAGVSNEASENDFTVSAATDPENGWGPPTKVEGVTFFGPMHVERIAGKGGIWAHALRVHNNQLGCLKYSYFSGSGKDRLPEHSACVDGTEASLHFVSENFGEPGYGQLAYNCDYRIREQGPGEDAMGAYGFLLEAHKWRNLQIRYREFMPLGIRPLLIPVT